MDNADKKKYYNKCFFFTKSKRNKYVILALSNIFAKIIEGKKSFKLKQLKFSNFIFCIYVKKEGKKISEKISIGFTAPIKLSLYFNIRKRIESNDRISHAGHVRFCIKGHHGNSI